ncbi:DUF3027 domain-containing protein [Bifidobacterium xylocopae]|uniref:DUF3027 domain-containing protein n=1 Tax=Bifidobacterium xylocopae TaxID=2493119 RepID=A0A366KEL3_9BIFI|nr:DUF3027 domain-containing protein [Bifidobacterium xylocopae]RBQ00135.1 hypothetical protein CRD59_00325 [Bifidobacterium xylocopae]
MPQEQRKPRDLARDVALSVASDPNEVGEFLGSDQGEGGVSEFRFASLIKGYEGWIWSVTLFHDAELDRWTVDESSLVPGPEALLPPAWVPWKDRLLPSDLSVTDAMGTEAGDPRLEPGMHGSDRSQALPGRGTGEDMTGPGEEGSGGEATEEASDGGAPQGGAVFKRAGETREPSDDHHRDEDAWLRTSSQDVDAAAEEFALSRRRVLSPLGRAEAAKRWYEGQPGPKSLSTRTAKGATCATCGFMVPLQGELGTMFGVCANRWSPDDGRVVALDHGCGEHSEIDPPQASPLWVQSKPAFDDLHIDVVEQAPREERPEVELIEQAGGPDRIDDEDDGDEQGGAAGVIRRRRRGGRRQ